MKRSSALLLTAAAPLFVAAKSPEPIETIVITANRVEQDVRKIAASVTVIDRQDIASSQYHNLPDILAWVTGIDISRDGGNGQSTSIFTRGTNTSQTLILVDGVRVGSATLGYKSIGNMPLDNIERIEIVKGPRAAQYGSDAIGGVIQIFTRKSTGAPLVSATYGSNSFYQASVAGGAKLSQGSIGGSLQQEKTDGYNVQPDAQADDDGYKNTNASLSGNWNLNDKVSTSLYGTFSDGYYEYDHSPFFIWHDKTDFTNWHINNQWQLRLGDFNTSVSVGASRDEEEYSGNEIEEIKYVTERQQFTINNEYRFNKETTFTFGYDGYKEDISSSSESFVNDDRINNAVFVGVLYNASNWGVNASGRNDHQTQFGDEGTYQVGAYWNASDWITVKANRGTGFKAPTFNDLYSPFGGNIDLEAETSESNEIGVELTFDILSASIFYFETDVDDLIVWTPDDELGYVWSAKNINSASIDGIELDLSFEFYEIRQNIGAAWIDATDDTTGDDLAKRADETYTYQAAYTLGETDFSLNYRYQSSRPAGDFANTQLSSYGLWSATVAHQFNDQISAKLRLENAFDKEYQTNLGYESAGREVFATVEYQF